MSDTPRTDANCWRQNGSLVSECVTAVFARQLERELAAKQAELDRLMLEFCPEEMTPEQIERWQASQRPVKKETE